MNSDIDISIIIVNFNTFELTCNCIESVLKFTKAIQFEIILVDNGSTEKTSKTFIDKFGNQIKFIQSEQNLGFAKGNNLGILEARADYILLLNSDTVLIEDCISKSLFKAKEIHQLGALTCKLLNSGGATFQNAARPFYSLGLHFLKTFRLDKLYSKPTRKIAELYNLENSFFADWIWGTFFLFPKSNLQLVGGRLSETFFMYSEDVEWCFLFQKKGLKNYYYAETAVIHLIGRSNNNVNRKKAILKSHLLFLKLYKGNLYSLLSFILFKIDNWLYKIKKLFYKK